jgi:hypothetical protein
MLTRKFQPRLFSSAEIESVAGLSQTMQRNWRRHKFLPSHEGKHSRYTLQELSTALAMKQLTDGGIPPSRAIEVATAIAPSVIWFALEQDGAWDVQGNKAVVADYRAFKKSDAGLADLERVTGIKVGTVKFYAIAFSSGKISLTGELTETFASVEEEMALVLNLQALGTRLAHRGGTLVTVSFGDQSRGVGE